MASGFESPTHVATPPHDPGRLFVVERAGRVRVVEDGRVRTFLDLRSMVTSAGAEQGLLSIAFHPDYADNGRFYVDYTDRNGDTNVVEYRRRGGSVTRVRRLLFVRQPFANHNGGQLAFGPDGLLWVSLGDGGGAGDPFENGQDLAGTRLAKLLKLDVDRPGGGWLKPAYGLRNPWRFSFDRASGDLYVGDVGQNRFEEITVVQHPGPLGPPVENFGWDVFEGRARFEAGALDPRGRYVRPLHVYRIDGHCSVIGGFVYRGRAIPELPGRYFFGDFCSGSVWSFRVRDGERSGFRREPFTVPQLTSFGEGADGELYLVSQRGTVSRLDSPAPRADAEWPIPLPDWFWPWARWYLGRGEFQGRARDDAVRPDAAPRRIPDWAWRRLDAVVGRPPLERASAFTHERLSDRFAAAGVTVASRRRSDRDPRWALVTGTVAQPRDVRFAAWLRMRRGRWTVHHLDLGRHADRPAPAAPVPADLR